MMMMMVWDGLWAIELFMGSPGWHSGDAGVCSGLCLCMEATELRVFTVVPLFATWNGGGVL